MNIYQLRSAALSLETSAGAASEANDSEAGWWRRLAVAAEALAGASTVANNTDIGWMYRAAVALEALSGTNGSQENHNYAGYMKRLADAAETLAGTTPVGDDTNRFLTAVTAGISVTIATQTETTALLARFTVQPDAARVNKINKLIYALKQAAVWDKIARLYVMSAHDQQAALRNWKADEDNLQVYGTVAFTTDYGFVSNGVPGSYLLADYNPTTDGGMTAGNGHLGAVVDTLSNTSVSADLGIVNTSNRLIIRDSVGGSIFGTVHATATAGATSPAPGSNHFCVSRTASNAVSSYLNGSFGATNTTATTPALPNGALTLCTNNAGATPSMRGQRAAHVGTGLTGTEAAAINTALKAYLA